MESLLPVLWALLVCAGLADGKKEPGLNLSCYQCFKVARLELCPPAQCNPTDRVCVSNTVVLAGRSQVVVTLSKRCAPRCPSTNTRYEWTSWPVASGRIVRQCCSGSLCNGGAAPRSALLGALLLLRLLWALL